MDILCKLAKEQYLIGETAVLLLKGQAAAVFDDAIMVGQIHGHAYADARWIKPDNKLNEFIKASNDQNSDSFGAFSADPTIAQNQASYCFFASSRVTLSPSHLFDCGIFLEFQLPATGCFPSFKGLSGGVNYFLTITVQSPSGMQHFHYPFTVNGSGAPLASVDVPQYQTM